MISNIMNISKKLFWVYLIILYCIGVLALTGAFLIIAINNNVEIELSKTVLKSFVIGIPPMFFPIYIYYKSKKY